MTVENLIEMLQGCDPSAIVVKESFDHSYRRLEWAGECFAQYSKEENHLCEAYEEQDEDLNPTGKFILDEGYDLMKVVVIG